MNSPAFPEVSIIIVAYNRLDLVEKCLTQVKKYVPKDSEIVFVDNNSTEDVAGFVERKHPQVKLIKSKTNLGFARGNNVAMKSAKGEFFLLLNTDCFLEKGVVEELVQFAKSHLDTGAAAPKLLNVDGSTQPSGGYFANLWPIFLMATTLDNWPIFKKFAPAIHVRDLEAFKKQRSFEWLAGACLLVPRKIFEQTKGMDEGIFMYGEEVEWLYRINRLGYKVYYDPKVSVTHVGFASSNPGNGATLEMESYVFFYKKYKPAWQMPILVGLLIFACVLRICRGILISDKRWMVGTYTRAIGKVLEDSIFKK